jgi:hypothetical protein
MPSDLVGVLAEERVALRLNLGVSIAGTASARSRSSAPGDGRFSTFFMVLPSAQQTGAGGRNGNRRS